MELELPSLETEKAILTMREAGSFESISPIIHRKDIEEIRETIESVHASEAIIDYIARIVSTTRTPLMNTEMMGISPRASLALLRASRVRAAFQERDYIIPEDVKALSPHVLLHRSHPTYHEEALGKTKYQLLEEILSNTPVSVS